jgi:hypothetical protein
MSFDLKITNGDFTLSNGDLATVNGQDKLIQDILKIAITTAGANPLQPWYGSLVSRTLIGSHLQTDIVISVAQSQLKNALENLKNLQTLQTASGQKTTPDELLSFISEVSVTRNASDPRLFSVRIKVLNKAFGKVSTAFNVNNT